MGKLKDETSQQVELANGFHYSPIGIEKLDDDQYTFLIMAYDTTGSVRGFAELMNLLNEKLLSACQKLPKVHNIIVMMVEFNDSIGVKEIHGFKLLTDIDPANDYPEFKPWGGTNLYDAAFMTVEAAITEGARLYDKGYTVNGVIFIVSDGDENSSRKIHDPGEIKVKTDEARRGEKISFLQTVLIGVKDPEITGEVWADEISVRLEEFQLKAGIDKYVDIGDATEESILKLVFDISQITSEVSEGTKSELTFS